MDVYFIYFNLLLFKFLRPKYTARGASAPLVHFDSLSSLLHCLYGLCMIPAPFRTNFQASLSLAIFLQPLTLIFFRSLSTSINHLFRGFPTEHFPSRIFLNTLFTVLSSGTLVTCPNHRNLPFIIPEIISVSLCRFIHSSMVRIIHTPFYFTGPNTFLNI